jgi:arginase family enzyme
MEISLYFEAVDFNQIGFDPEENTDRIGDQIEYLSSEFSDEELSEFDVLIFGVNEDRNSQKNNGAALAPDQIRKYLYNLKSGKNIPKIGDLGNIPAGSEISDTYFAVKSTVHQLLEAGTIPLILGGSNDLTYAAYLGFEANERIINLVCIDAKIDHYRNDENPNSESYLSNIFYRKPNFLFNFSNIGYQTYFTSNDSLKLLDKLYFDASRLGEVRQNIEEMEPTLRNADFVSFDIASVRQADAPGCGNASPNGFYGEEACQLIRYAGLSSKLSCIGFFNVNPLFDQRGQTAHLVAQMIWYFFDGIANRVSDYPGEDKSGFIKYTVNTSGQDNDLIFFKSKATDRWWMELPVSRKKEKDLLRHIMVPCSYKDYLDACHNEIPDRWWKAYQKLM